MDIETVITIDGVDYDLAGRKAIRCLPVSLMPYDQNGDAEFRFQVHTQQLRARPYPFHGKPVQVKVDGRVVFSGVCRTAHVAKADESKYVYDYYCYSLKHRANRCSVRDDQTGTSTINFNLRGDDPTYIASRAGRSVGEVILSVLEMGVNRANLVAQGVGNYTSAGTGAAAHAVLTGSTVTSVVVDAGGAGYTAAPTVFLLGGTPTTAGAGHAHVSGGAVTSVDVDAGGTAYQTTPTVLLSTLPAATLADLATLTIRPPFPLTVAGEQLLDGIEAMLRAVYPNHMVTIDGDGTLRFRDRSPWPEGAHITLTDATGRGCVAMPVFTAGVLTGVLIEDGGLGYTAPTASIAGGHPAVAATLGAVTVAAGQVVGIAVAAGGSGYDGNRILDITLGINPVDPPSLQIDMSHCYSRVEVRGRPFVEAVELSTVDGTLVEDFGHDALTNAQAKANWHWNDFDMGALGVGTALARCELGTGAYTDKVTVLHLDYGGFGYGGVPAVVFVGGGGTGATAHATLSGTEVDAIYLDTKGSGYTSAPAVILGNPLGVSTDYFTCTCPDTLTVRVTSTDPTRKWAANAWDQTATGLHGVAYLQYPVGTGVTTAETRRVVANTALTAGGTSDLTLDLPLSHTNFTLGSVRGLQKGGSIVGRRYKPADAAVGQHLTNEPFSFPTVYTYCNGAAGELVSQGIGEVRWSSNALPPYQGARVPIDCDPDAGTITFQIPVVRPYGVITRLQRGYPTLPADGLPYDVRVLVGVYKDNLSVAWPADDKGSPTYAGTAHTAEGLAETLVVQMDDWRDPGQRPHVLDYAKELLKSVQDTIVEADIVWEGALPSCLTPGVCVNVLGVNGQDNGGGGGLGGGLDDPGVGEGTGTGPGEFVTGLESAALHVAAVMLEYTAGGPVPWRTTLHVSNRRAAYTARPFLPPPRQAGPLWGNLAGDAVFAMGGYAGLNAMPVLIGPASSVPAPAPGMPAGMPLEQQLALDAAGAWPAAFSTPEQAAFDRMAADDAARNPAAAHLPSAGGHAPRERTPLPMSPSQAAADMLRAPEGDAPAPPRTRPHLPMTPSAAAADMLRAPEETTMRDDAAPLGAPGRPTATGGGALADAHDKETDEKDRLDLGEAIRRLLG